MNELTILEGNRLIAEFMEQPPDPLCASIKKDGYAHCKYHNSWNWLMPVVDKIEATYTAVIEFIKWHNKNKD